jgi:hypothetical protein
MYLRSFKLEMLVIYWALFEISSNVQIQCVGSLRKQSAYLIITTVLLK